MLNPKIFTNKLVSEIAHEVDAIRGTENIFSLAHDRAENLSEVGKLSPIETVDAIPLYAIDKFFAVF